MDKPRPAISNLPETGHAALDVAPSDVHALERLEIAQNCPQLPIRANRLNRPVQLRLKRLRSLPKTSENFRFRPIVSTSNRPSRSRGPIANRLDIRCRSIAQPAVKLRLF